MKLGSSDRKLLNALQEDASHNQGDLAIHCGMSRTSCWRRVRDFEEIGLIERRVALLNPDRAGFQIHVLLSVSMTEHTDKHRTSFEAHLLALPQVMEAFSVSGDKDYVLLVVAKDMAGYNTFLNTKILSHFAVHSASSTFCLRRVKYTTKLPL